MAADFAPPVKKPGKLAHHGLAPSTATLWLSHVQLATILINFLQAVNQTDIGYENTKKTLPDFLKELDALPKVKMPVEMLEDILCAVNFRSESGAFFSAKEGEDFDQLLKGLFWLNRVDGVPLTFDKAYNVIKFKE